MSNARKQEFDRRYKVYEVDNRYKARNNDRGKVIYMDDIRDYKYTKLPPNEIISKEEEMEVIIDIQRQIRRENQGRKIQRPKSKPKKRLFTGKRVATIVLAISMLLAAKGISNAHTNYQQQNEPAGIVQILQEGSVELEELELELGITNEQVSKIIEIQNALEREDITNEELIRLVPQVYQLQLDIIKSKTANTLGVSPENIRVHSESTREGTTREYIEVKNESGQRIALYNEKDIFTNKNTISEGTAQMIRSTGSTQDRIKMVQEGDLKREEIIAQCKEALKETSQFAGMKLQVDEKGRMTDQKIKAVDLEQKNKENIYNKVANDALSNETDDGLEL